MFLRLPPPHSSHVPLPGIQAKKPNRWQDHLETDDYDYYDDYDDFGDYDDYDDYVDFMMILRL